MKNWKEKFDNFRTDLEFLESIVEGKARFFIFKCPSGFIHKRRSSAFYKNPWIADLNSVIDKESYVLNRLKSVHKDKYTYDRFRYTGYQDKSTITCRLHGDFEQMVSSHLIGNGCKKCLTDDNKVRNVIRAKEKFILRQDTS